MNKFILKNPEDFSLESAIITHDLGTGLYIMDIYDKTGHTEYSGKTQSVLKSKFTREIASVNPSAKPAWLKTDYQQYTEDDTPEEMEEDETIDTEEEEVSVTADFVVNAIAKKLIAWIDTLPEEAKVVGFDLGGTKYTFREIRMDLIEKGSIGQLMIEAIMNMTLKFIEGTLVPKDVPTSQPEPEEHVDTTENTLEPPDAQDNIGISLLFGLFTSIKILPGGNSEITIQTSQDFMQAPLFEGGQLTRPFVEPFPVEVRLMAEQGD